MKILMFGRGVISTLYGRALEGAGNDVTFYVRPGRSVSLGTSVSLDVKDGRGITRPGTITEQWPVTLVEEIRSDHDYDLIIVSVNHDQLDDALQVLRGKVGDATVLMFNNVWAEPTDVIAALPADHVVWGFPGGGGGFTEGRLRGAFLRTVFMGDIDGSSTTARHRMVRNLFRRAGFTIVASRDFRSWLWLHFLMDAALAARALSTGSFSTVLRSASELEQAAVIAREIVPVMIIRGGRVGLAGHAVARLPPTLIARVLKQILGSRGIPRFIMEQVDHSAHGGPAAVAAYVSDVLATARRYQVPVPRLEETAAAFPIIDDRARALADPAASA
ncbi:ketopantoate reductase family protein [Microlunatus soli]|uniref:Ketopantoate reductase n=1 Tax=Microlunatus soli TaxID=630515 RepID=A0A1H1R096_9ACTN|nr:2-dehydropantoate 2-reductase N-terminal domain-containing protein [Microlunatus soli]SDS28965.1 ketopantoate reductase [Microlunatus soli]